MGSTLWKNCLERLESVLPPQQYNTWIRPLQAVEENNSIQLLAPNRFVLDWIKEKYLDLINSQLEHLLRSDDYTLTLEVGSQAKLNGFNSDAGAEKNKPEPRLQTSARRHADNLNPAFKFNSFVEGKSNQLARAASVQTSENPGSAYNPLFIYGGVGLGKTHLMHAIGHKILEQ